MSSGYNNLHDEAASETEQIKLQLMYEKIRRPSQTNMIIADQPAVTGMYVQSIKDVQTFENIYKIRSGYFEVTNITDV